MVLSASPGKTSVVLNPVDDPPAKRTYVVFGLERGGTSPVAGIMRALGLDLGDIDEGNNEDKRFQAKGLGQLRGSINERNESQDIWGWKYPPAVSYLPVLVKAIRNPYFVVVFRDAVATALSRHQWDGKFLRRGLRMSLHEANTNTNANTSFALATGRPCLLISNEKAARDTDALIDEIAEFLDVEPPAESHRARIHDYLKPGAYKPFAEFFPEIPPFVKRSRTHRPVTTHVEADQVSA
jgi:hypothetical protein